MAVRKTAKGLALKRWFKEDWRTPRGKKGYSGSDRTFRPTKKVSSKTPVTWKGVGKRKAAVVAQKKAVGMGRRTKAIRKSKK